MRKIVLLFVLLLATAGVAVAATGPSPIGDPMTARIELVAEGLTATRPADCWPNLSSTSARRWWR